jgi:Leucine-rich repeat (LRR) protein
VKRFAPFDFFCGPIKLVGWLVGCFLLLTTAVRRTILFNNLHDRQQPYIEDMSAWGKGGSLRSCDSLLTRVEQNDPALVDLVILPMKAFGATEATRLSDILSSGCNTHLKSLTASGHALPPDALEALGRALANCNVSSLAVGDQTMGDVGVAALCKGLAVGITGDSRLYALDLSMKGIGNDGMESIVNTLGACHSLTSLILTRNSGVGQFDFGVSTDPIFSSVKHLDLSECCIDSKFCQGLAPRLAEASALVLSLGMNDELVGADAMSCIMKLSLVELNLAECSIADEGLQVIVDQAPKKLRSLDVSSNQIGPLGIQHLAEKLKAGQSGLCGLEELNLSHNRLNEESTGALAHAIGDATSNNELALTRLDMTDTSCGVGGVMDFLQFSRLEELTVFDNRLGSDGFVALAKCLTGGHPYMSTLDIGGNEATEAGVVALLQPLTQKSDGFDNALRLLVVGGNATGPTVESVCSEIKAVHPEIEVLREKPKTNGGQAN